ncbi:amino acid ABC transporter permease, partial [Salmonella enterica subsp. enterica serovar Infantis]
MNKTRQKELTRWLKQQSVISQRWLNISRLLGFMSGVLIVAQAWIMARILQHMIMENIPREALLLPFILLILVFVLRAWVVWLRECSRFPLLHDRKFAAFPSRADGQENGRLAGQA